MALETENGTGTVMPVMPMGYGNGGFGGIGDFGGGGWWFLILFFLMMGGGFGGYGGGMNGMWPWMNQSNQISDGFQTQALNTSINGVQNSINAGFAGLTAQLNGNQIAELERSFAEQTANTNGFFNLQSQLANCCCENRLATQGLQSVIQSENCADRAAISDGIRDILVAQNAGVQKILDEMCADRLNRKDEKIAELQNKLNMASFNASQLAQDNYLQNALTAQTQYFLALYPPTVPATTPAT